ncbi:MAG TPA: DUF6516 family protein [Caulobacteraceae bacterium]
MKRVYDDGRIVEARIWLVPIAVRGSDHQLKYSLSYGSDGDRVVGYDNEAGKGDHRHYNDRQEAYAFTTVEKLVADFLADVSRIRGDAI